MSGLPFVSKHTVPTPGLASLAGNFLLLLFILPLPAIARDRPAMFLASIVDVALKPGERIENFRVETWGVTFNAVCHVPRGWRIGAGNSATPEGVIEGQGSHGVTWFDKPSPLELRDFVLLTLYPPVRENDIGDAATSVIPATFKGHATIQTTDAEHRVPLTHANLRLRPAAACPPVRR